MKLINNIEVCGITRIVVKKKDSTRIYIRNDNRDWVEQPSSKVILDKFMCSRVRKMIKSRPLNLWLPEYRMWIHNETLNFEKM